MSVLRRLVGLWRSFTLRLALAFMAAFAVLVALMLALGYWTTVERPLASVRSSLDAEAIALATLYGDGRGERAMLDALDSRVRAPAAREFYFIFTRPDGTRAAGNLPLHRSQLTGGPWLRVEFEVSANGLDLEHEAVLRAVGFADGARLIVGRDTEDLDEREELITEVLWQAVLLTLVLGLAGGLALSLGVGRRIDEIGRSAQRVLVGDLSERVPLRGVGDDFDRLSATLNAMLDRIQSLIGSISRVSDNIAHELRTPLARLSADLETLESRAGAMPAEELKARAAAALEDIVRMQRIFDALLRVARIEAGRDRAGADPLDFAALAGEAVELYEPVAAGRGVDLRFTPGETAPVLGDRHLLFQAVGNLLDNAIKFTPAGGSVDVRVAGEGPGAVFEVRDSGPGVSPADRARLGERFFRPTPAPQGEEGHGLGLALTAAIARVSGGRLAFPPANKGLIAQLRLPAGGGASHRTSGAQRASAPRREAADAQSPQPVSG